MGTAQPAAPAERLYSSLVEIEQSQYSMGTPSACTLLACEVAYRLLSSTAAPSEEDNRGMLTEALSTSTYHSEYHLEAQEVLEACTRFRTSLQVAKYTQLQVDHFHDLLADMHTAQREGGGRAVATVVTKPPETVLLFLSAQGTLHLFDSHPREHHQGAALIDFESEEQCLGYLARLFPVMDGMEPEFAFLYSMCDASILTFNAPQQPKIPETEKVELMLHRSELDSLSMRKAQQESERAKQESERALEELRRNTATRDLVFDEQTTRLALLEKENKELRGHYDTRGQYAARDHYDASSSWQEHYAPQTQEPKQHGTHQHKMSSAEYSRHNNAMHQGMKPMMQSQQSHTAPRSKHGSGYHVDGVTEDTKRRLAEIGIYTLEELLSEFRYLSTPHSPPHQFSNWLIQTVGVSRTAANRIVRDLSHRTGCDRLEQSHTAMRYDQYRGIYVPVY